jgi:hypothetical protein
LLHLIILLINRGKPLMSLTYLTTEELWPREKYDSRTIREQAEGQPAEPTGAAAPPKAQPPPTRAPQVVLTT